MDNVILFLKKFGTILADRRFAAAVASLALMFLSLPEDQTGEILKAIGILVNTALLILSWAYREPSGLDYGLNSLARRINKTYETK